ncbi:hypothetical protein A3H75_00190 [Candidatus Uhrbacteria bacterium RIFCSPLOWO2_02_FULL_51_9]|uniref:Uncharacterized protein n=1 Tax=Candidatus Uhrbacteria bacterium RIFCSPLOWO2_02_FULL_51_9 TaxID=1802410 RepID=A0A1F7VGH0_9BACT|nr:MAG: hypothetical protein A3H75_00190 [Candidatus Uhrbacteria bacterium RIFCSPLOWO2_02_FULL_51_9]
MMANHHPPDHQLGRADPHDLAAEVAHDHVRHEVVELMGERHRHPERDLPLQRLRVAVPEAADELQRLRVAVPEAADERHLADGRHLLVLELVREGVVLTHRIPPLLGFGDSSLYASPANSGLARFSLPPSPPVYRGGYMGAIGSITPGTWLIGVAHGGL